MGCEQFGQQACVENDRTADRLARMLDSSDPTQSADAIRRELYDRPPALSIDLLGRIQQYDQKGLGADLRIDPLIRRVPGPYGNQEYFDTGDREVVIDSDLGRDQIAILRGAPEQRYDRYPEPRRLDPFSMITEMLVGGMLNGAFSRWGHQPRRDCWQEQNGRMWYPQPGGRWGQQRFSSWGQQSPFQQSYDRGPSMFFQDPRHGWNGRNPNQWRGQSHQGQDQWRGQKRWQGQQRWQDHQMPGRGQGQVPDWARRMQEQHDRRAPVGTQEPGRGQIPDWARRRQEQHDRRPTQELPNRNDGRQPPLNQPDRTPRPDQVPHGQPNRWVPGQGRHFDGQPPVRRETPRLHIPEQNQPPNFRNGGRHDMPRREAPAIPPRVVAPPGRVVPPPQQQHQPGNDRRRQR